MNPSDSERFPARRKTRPVKVGRLTIGGDAAIVVQSMTNTDTRDAATTVRQIKELEDSDCELVRVAVPRRADTAAFAQIVPRVKVPLIADIHFSPARASKPSRPGPTSAK
jgi:(E)-4-hydroxy-3-methylbut-2-enyl-diphosphate synthase